MDTKQLTQLRNFFIKAFLIGLAAFLILLFGTIFIWDIWSSFIQTKLNVEPAILGELVVNSFLLTRMIIIFLFLVPAIALHVIIKKSK
ncbi:MAG: hypothetical protein Q8S44_08180 [Flavobacteriaceae bacterium]|nr:hypothetical protein [Flavobacteriaceae bacterium]